MSIHGEVYEPSVEPGYETSNDSTENSSKEVSALEVIMDGSGLEKLHGHPVVGDSDGGVDGSTGMGSGEKDHSAESHGDSEDAEHALVFHFFGGERKSDGVLADEVGHGEDGSSGHLQVEGLPPSDALRHQVGELFGASRSSTGLVGDHEVDHSGSGKSSENLEDDHEKGLG